MTTWTEVGTKSHSRQQSSLVQDRGVSPNPMPAAHQQSACTSGEVKKMRAHMGAIRCLGCRPGWPHIRKALHLCHEIAQSTCDCQETRLLSASAPGILAHRSWMAKCFESRRERGGLVDLARGARPAPAMTRQRKLKEMLTEKAEDACIHTLPEKRKPKPLPKTVSAAPVSWRLVQRWADKGIQLLTRA